MALIITQIFNIIILISTYLIDYKIPFNITKPEIKIELSKELKEISGLSWYDQSTLAAIQDEAGIVYIVDANTGEIKEKIKFSLPGDFEGIEVVDGTIYTLTSGGTLFAIDKNNSNKVERIETRLNWINDVEGLAYDRKIHSLLIACKGQASTQSDNNIKGKAIYALELDNHQLSEQPVAIIKKSALGQFVDVEKFKPSALAIDPLTGYLYVLASAGNRLVILDQNFEVIMALKLPAKIYAQPEGICFSPDGDLYISNEETKKSRANFYHLLRQH